MVATTFSTDTPNLVTDIVRQDGVAGNWVWWAFLLTGMLTVFVYAKLWRRCGVMTDIEFYELRYSGRAAAFLRCFRAVYLGVFFNIVIMATVTLAAIKIGGVLFGMSAWQSVSIAAVVTVCYSMLGGLRGVLITDLLQFAMAMSGAVAAAAVAVRLPEVGGLDGLFSNPAVAERLRFVPGLSDADLLVSVFIIPLAVQWWSVWYPGSEPGGGGYLVQRMLAAKDEKNAVLATFLFNASHYALRPWPWIIVALCSIVVFPDLESLRSAFPSVEAKIVRHDMAYPAMLTRLPRGLLGLVAASLIAAYMSTISTHLNWGSSYIVNDVYRRFINPAAGEGRSVLVGRASTVLLMVAACVLARYLENAKRAFDLILQIGAGTGLLFILRWFWWRINAFSEITAMAASFFVACYFELVHPHTGLAVPPAWQKLVTGVSLTTAAWVAVTLLTPPANEHTLRSFYRLAQPGGPGWRRVLRRAAAEGQPLVTEPESWPVPGGILCMFLGTAAVYTALFATGCWIYGRIMPAAVLTTAAAVAAVMLVAAARRCI